MSQADGEGWILVVDDDEDFLGVLVELLGGEGYRVHTAPRGQQACDLVARLGSPRLLLVDVMMPDMDGYEVMRRVRAMAPEVHTVVMTALPTARERAALEAADIDDHVSKPIDIDGFLRMVDRLVRGQA